MLKGIVIRTGKGGYEVQCDKELVRCVLRPRIRKADERLRAETKEMPLADLVSVGDRVTISTSDGVSGHIEEILPRKSQFGRTRVGKLPQVIAANLDALLIIFATRDPALNFRMLDRFLVTAEAAAMDPVICINKMDLEKQRRIRSDMAIYEEFYPVIYASAVTGEGVDALRDAMKDRISAVAGPSGVGKSTLLNAIQPGLRLRIGDVSESTRKGQHTTTGVELMALDCGGYVADTPGIRALGLFEIPLQHLDGLFPEMNKHLIGCKYPSCSHTHEPDCAVKEALDAGEISKRRYDSYLRLLGAKNGRYERRTKGQRRK